ncbi:MAG: hypothetical protein CVU00_14665 [Bacteroidetes bacterium HGW-Bacteroidetes-17]|nr:MAG: hypothetical protein CVU00_14665 [Bacteroidetes bacterium HGW-Bacteroidetes-17]
MTTLFKKLNYKGEKEICIVNAPDGFKGELKEIANLANIITKPDDCREIKFILTFVKTKTEVDELIPILSKKLKGDGIVWFAYPKKTSKKYKVEIHRDHGWELVRKLGFESVRAVAIDEDWSTLRFRKVEYIKTMSRNKIGS